MDDEILQRVRTIAEPILSEEGMELLEVEYRRESRGWILRLYIDKQGGVTLDDCTRVSREVGRNLDVEDFIPSAYTLEISSPGLTRPLKTAKDFLRYRNRLVHVKTLSPVENRSHFSGRLLGISEKGIEIEADGQIFQILLSNVSKANLEVEW